MGGSARKIMLWSPRILGLLVALFLGVFALDASGEGIVAFLLHAAPCIVLLLVVALSWRREWVGGAVFTTVAVLYAALMWRRPDWVLLISGPLLLTGALFLWSWGHHKEPHAGN